MTYLLLGGPQYPKVRKKKSLTDSDKKQFGDRLWKNLSLDSDLIGLIKPQSLPNKKCGEKKFDLTNIMKELRFDHMRLAGTDRN